MKQNMGSVDRLVRGFVLAPILLVVAWFVGVTTVVGAIAAVLAVVMIVTAAVGFCPLYLPFHLDTDRSHRSAA